MGDLRLNRWAVLIPPDQGASATWLGKAGDRFHSWASLEGAHLFNNRHAAAQGAARHGGVVIDVTVAFGDLL